MNTGMDGSLSTGHGNSPSDMLVRLETMVLMGLEMPLSAVRRQIASGIDILIHLGRLRDKSRRVLEIREVTGYDYESGEIVTSVLYEFLEKLPGALAPGGRAAILTFHSGEDKLVKKSFKEYYKEGIYAEIAKDVIRPSARECAENPRAHSTKMRWAIKAE